MDRLNIHIESLNLTSKLNVMNAHNKWQASRTLKCLNVTGGSSLFSFRNQLANSFSTIHVFVLNQLYSSSIAESGYLHFEHSLQPAAFIHRNR